MGAIAGLAALAYSAAAPAAVMCFDAAGKWREDVSQIQGETRCHNIALPANATVQWAFMPGKPLSSSPRLAATGAGGAARFQPMQVVADDPGSAVSVALPFGQPLLPRLLAAPFGAEERATLTHNEAARVTVSCRPGALAAGVVLRAQGVHLPRGAVGSLRIVVSGGSGFSVGLASTGQDPGALQSVPMTPGPNVIDIPLPVPGRVDAALMDSLVIVCPASAAKLTLIDVQLLAAGAPQGHKHAGWAWAQRRWHDEADALLQAAIQHRIRTIYISVSVSGNRLSEPVALAHFVRRAAASGVAVWAVEGDPGMVLAPGREHALARLAAIRQYQSSAVPDARLAGIQYDIEPYLLPAYADHPLDIAQQWRDTLRALSDAADRMSMDIVLPFWVLSSPGGADVLSPARRPGRSITAMAYRTDLAEIQSAAEPLLAWGTFNKVPVRVALEAGPLQDELTQYYAVDHSAENSILWLVPVDGTEVVVRLDRPMRLERGRGYQPIRDSFTPASQVSFHGNLQRMRTTIDALQGVFPAWASYAGMSLHGLLD